MPYPDPVPDLPQELVDHIIDKLHADKTALKFCSLVASTWTARSHYHLFYEVEILNETQRDAWTRLFPHPCASVVADLVRRLHIDQPSILEDIAKFSLEQFRNLVHFSLGCMPFHQRTGSELGASAMDNIRLLPTSLRGLHLGLGHTYVWHITSLCGHFQDLDDLSVRSHSFKPGRQPQETALESSPRFRGELRVAIGTDFFALTDLLQSLPNGVQFTRVNLSLPLPPGSPCKVGVWLQSVAETLTSLHIDATLQSECCGRWGHFSKGVPLGLRVTFAHTVTSVISRVFQRVDVVIDLSPLQKLTTLCLRLKPAFISPSIVAQTIESAASGISTIELTLVGPIITKNWASVDGAIAALAPRCSQPLRVTINGAQKDEESRMFPRASSMGLLQVRLRDLLYNLQMTKQRYRWVGEV